MPLPFPANFTFSRMSLSKSLFPELTKVPVFPDAVVSAAFPDEEAAPASPPPLPDEVEAPYLAARPWGVGRGTATGWMGFVGALPSNRLAVPAKAKKVGWAGSGSVSAAGPSCPAFPSEVGRS